MNIALQKKKKLLKILFMQSKTATLGGILIALIIFVFFMNQSNRFILTGWLVFYVSVRLLQHYISYRVVIDDADSDRVNYHFRLFALLLALAGSSWGAMAIFLISQEENILYTVIIIVLIEGMIAASVAIYSVAPWIFCSLACTSIFPLGIYLVSQSEKFYRIHGTFALLFMVFMTAITFRLHKQIAKSIEYQFTNLHLLNQLHDEKNKMQSLANQLNELSKLDGLTGIANRRAFDERMGLEWARNMRSGNPLSLIMCDIDFFKPYNDHYGHLEGDACLNRIAHILHDFARRSGDIAARYGGEEFTIILPETTLEDAVKVTGQIRDKIAEEAIPHEKSTVSNAVTLSFGVTTVVPTQDISINQFIKKADKLLYRAKELGRNRIVAEEYYENYE